MLLRVRPTKSSLNMHHMTWKPAAYLPKND